MLVVIHTFMSLESWEEDKWIWFYCGRFFTPLISNFLLLIYLWINSCGHNEKRKLDSLLSLPKTKMFLGHGRGKYSGYSMKERQRLPFSGPLLWSLYPCRQMCLSSHLIPCPSSLWSLKPCKHFILILNPVLAVIFTEPTYLK